MKRLIVIVAVFSFSLLLGIVQAEEVREKGASQTARQQTSDRAIFNRVTDWFATVGRSEEEKERILEERQARRLERQAEREAREAEKESRKKERQMQRDAEQKAGEAEDEGSQRKGPPAYFPRGRQ